MWMQDLQPALLSAVHLQVLHVNTSQCCQPVMERAQHECDGSGHGTHFLWESHSDWPASPPTKTARECSHHLPSSGTPHQQDNLPLPEWDWRLEVQADKAI